MAPPPDPLVGKTVPSRVADVPDVTQWQGDVFTPYLGKTFAEVQTTVLGTIRNAVAHLTPGGNSRVADHLEDVEACQSDASSPVHGPGAHQRGARDHAAATLVARPGPFSRPVVPTTGEGPGPPSV